MHSLRQKCRPKHQVMILNCYPRTIKGAVDVKPNSSELSYLLYYATTRRSKVQKVGAFLEKRTAHDLWRLRTGNVQITLQILAALIEKAPRDLPLYAPYVLKILSMILRKHDITLAESSIPTWDAFCQHHDTATLSADQEYLHQYEEIVRIYAAFASTRQPFGKVTESAPVALRWRSAGLTAIKSVASSEALASVAGRQLNVVVPKLLENLWTDNEDWLDLLQEQAEKGEQVESEKLALRRRNSVATVRTTDTSGEANPAAASGTVADADKQAEDEIGVLAVQCLKQVFVVNNRTQLHGATLATIDFIADRVAEGDAVVGEGPGRTCQGWAPRIFDMIARWTPLQDRYVIVVAVMDKLVRSPLVESDLQNQLVLATIVDSLLKSDINLVGLSIMDVLVGLIQHILRVLQLNGAGAVPHLLQQDSPTDDLKTASGNSSQSIIATEVAASPTNLRIDLLAQLQSCVGHLATHVYYADQISDMVRAILIRLKPSPNIGSAAAAAAIEHPNEATEALVSGTAINEDPNIDSFFSFDTAKIKALEAIKAVLLVASAGTMTGAGGLARNRVPLHIWEGTQWLLRDADGRVRKAYVDAFSTFLERETRLEDLKVTEPKYKSFNRTNRDDSGTNLSKRAVSTSTTAKEKVKTIQSSFLQLLHLAVYENAHQYWESEADINLLHALLYTLVHNLGINAARAGLPMIFRLQEDILVAQTPIAKIRLGSLCHGYFWTLCLKFEFKESTPGLEIQGEIQRRQVKNFWVDRVRQPPMPLDQIGTPGRPSSQPMPPVDQLKKESLLPFDNRFEVVKLISLSYAQLVSSAESPPGSPGRSPPQPAPTITDNSLPDSVKEQMMTEWSKAAVLESAQETSKTASICGSRSGASVAHRNFLAITKGKNGTVRNSSPQSQDGRSRSSPTHYGTLQKLRKGSGVSLAPSESSRNSVTRIDGLKQIVSGQQFVLPGTRAGRTQSDASSDSMVSCDFTMSDVSYNPAATDVPLVDRSASMRGASVDRARSKSRDKDMLPSIMASPLNGHDEESHESVPPVPPLPGGTVAVDYASGGGGASARGGYFGGESRNGRSLKSRGGDRDTNWGSRALGDRAVPGTATIGGLQGLLKEIEGGSEEEEEEKSTKPPY